MKQDYRGALGKAAIYFFIFLVMLNTVLIGLFKFGIIMSVPYFF